MKDQIFTTGAARLNVTAGGTIYVYQAFGKPADKAEIKLIISPSEIPYIMQAFAAALMLKGN